MVSLWGWVWRIHGEFMGLGVEDSWWGYGVGCGGLVRTKKGAEDCSEKGDKNDRKTKKEKVLKEKLTENIFRKMKKLCKIIEFCFQT